VAISEQPSQQRTPGDGIVRYTGLSGAATLTSRGNGLVRDQGARRW